MNTDLTTLAYETYQGIDELSQGIEQDQAQGDDYICTKLVSS
jgi:hypothetical protein